MTCLIRFFEDYKKNENKQVVVDTMLGAKDALQAVKSAIVRHICITLFLTQILSTASGEVSSNLFAPGHT